MIPLHKPMGPTAFQALCALRDADPSLRGAKLGHTGRLDPLAEGLLLALVGDENRTVVARRGADKTYAIVVAFGVATDSFDSLGIVAAAPGARVAEPALRGAIPRWVGAVSQRVAPFSQARVDGRSLIAHGHAGAAGARPARDRTIYGISLDALSVAPLAALAREAAARVDLVRGDFRQDAIRARWSALTDSRAELTLASLTVDCSAGTFMRSLAHDLGEALGAPAMVWRILRTRVGDVTLDGARTLP